MRVDERDLEPEEAAPRPLVDQLGAVRREPLRARRRRRRPRTRRGASPGPRWRGTCRPACRARATASSSTRPSPTRIDRGLDALVGDGLAVLELGAEKPPVGVDGLVEVGDRDAEVMDSRARP